MEDSFEEKLEIELGIENFISGLNKAVNQYNSSIKNINSINATLGKNFESLQNFVSSSLNSMSGNVAQKVELSVTSTKKVVDSASKELKNLTNAVSENIKQINTKLDILGKGDLGVEQIKALKSELKTLNQQYFSNVSKSSEVTMKAVVATAETSSKAIGSTIYGLKTKLAEIRDSAGGEEVDIDKFISSKSTFRGIIKQQKELGDQIKILDKMRTEAFANAEQSRLAVNAQTELSLRQEAQRTYDANLQYLNNLNIAYKKAKTNQASLAENIAATKASLDTQASFMRGKLQESFSGISSESFNKVVGMRDVIGDMTKNLGVMGQKGQENVTILNSEFQDLNKSLKQDLVELKNVISTMSKLSSSDVKSKELLPGLEKSLSILEAFSGQYQDSANLINKLSLTGPLVRAEEKYKIFSNKVKDSLDLVEENIKRFKNIGNFDNVFNIEQGFKYWKGMKDASGDYTNVVKGTEKQLFDLQIAYNSAIRDADKNHGTEREAIYRSYANNVLQQIERVKNAQLEASIKSKENSEQEFYMKEKLIVGSKNYSDQVKKQTVEWSKVPQMQKDLISLYEQIRASASKTSRSSKENTEGIEKSFVLLRDKLILYRNEMETTIRSLKSLTSKGLINANDQIAALEKIKKHYDGFATTLSNKSGGVEKMVRAQAQRVEQAWYTTAWNTVRNFRWQYAAMYYLATQFASFFQRTFFGVLKEVDEYRKAVYALTVSIGMSLGKNFASNYNLIYNYSRELMDRLQAKAAETYVSLQDLLMITRSFAQAGIFPKTDKDIENISALATAVSIMTEGMANAGTQMKQEITALIEGRARVTDSVALAFKLQGINIKKEMAEWRRTGIDMLTGFGILFEPFLELNRKVTNEYGVQINRLNEMWNYIKRIAGESLLGGFAKDINEFVASLGTPGKELTERGKALVTLINQFLASVWSTGKAILETVSAILSLFGKITASLFGINNIYTDIEKTGDGLTDALNEASASINILSNGFNVVLGLVKDIVEGIESIVNFFDSFNVENITNALEFPARSLFSGGGGSSLRKSASAAMKKEVFENWDKVFGDKQQTNVEKAIEKWEKSINDFKENLKRTKDQGKDTFETLANKIQMVTGAQFHAQLLAEIDTDLKKLRKEGLSGKDLINFEYDEVIKDWEVRKDTIVTGMNTIKDTIKRVNEEFTQGKITSEEKDNYLKSLNEKLKVFQEGYEQTNEILIANEVAKNRKLEDLNATYAKNYQEMLEKLGSINPYEKLYLEYQTTIKEIEKAALHNTYFQQNLENLKGAANKKYWSDYMELQAQANDKAMDLQRKITGQEQGGISKITEEYKNYGREIEKAYLAGQLGEGQLNEKVREHLTSLLAVNEALAKRRYLVEVNMELQGSYLDLAESQATYLSESLSFSDRRMAQLITEQTSFERYKIDIIRKIEEIKRKYAESPEVVNAMTKNLQEQLNIQAQLLEKHKEEIMNPFWNDMRKMSDEWAESFSDSMADVFMGTKTLAEAMNDLLKSSFRDILKSFIKNQLVTPMMDQLNGAKDKFEGGSSGIWSSIKGLFGFGGQQKAGENKGILDEVTMGTPLPVMVTNMTGMMQGFAGMGGNIGSNANVIQDLINEQKSVAVPKNLANKDWLDFLKTESERKKLDYSVMLALVNRESSGNPKATGSIGERGLMQLTPGAVKDVGANFSEMYDPYKNITAGTDYFRKKLNETNNNYYDALRSYNAGFGGAMKNPNAGADYAKAIMDKSNQSFETITANFKQVSDNANKGFDSTFTNFDTTFKKFDSSSVLTTDYLNQNKNNMENNLLTGVGTTNPIPVFVTNMNAMGTSITGTSGILGQDVSQKTEEAKSQTSSVVDNFMTRIKSGFTSLTGTVGSVFSGIGSLIMNLLSSFSGMGGGGSGGLFGGLFGGGKTTAMKEGGVISEPIFGVGLRSAKPYSFGESESEIVTPMSKMNQGRSNIINDARNKPSTQVYFNISMNSIDSKSGVDFIVQHAPVYEAMMSKALKNNKRIRNDIRNSY